MQTQIDKQHVYKGSRREMEGRKKACREERRHKCVASLPLFILVSACLFAFFVREVVLSVHAYVCASMYFEYLTSLTNLFRHIHSISGWRERIRERREDGVRCIRSNGIGVVMISLPSYLF
mmetsp:Transcript_13515/g.26786  ORF Transcript_13515/g.26786 Transcript_13515/m.26786 type:complete len:121 (-) Transcript_13515:1655-2017(-)